MSKIIGIDLGTSNSAAVAMIGNKPTVIQAAEGVSIGGKAFPSIVAFTKAGQLLVGEPARRQMISNAEGTIIAAKRKMGTDFKFNIFGKEYTPQQISSFILQKIKKDAEDFLGETVDKAVITVPAYFNDNQRQATKDAGEIVGLQVETIINEPTAAALAYAFDKVQEHFRLMVFDLGGGTLDVTIMEKTEGFFQVKSTAGDTQLGGTDMDNALIDYIIQEFKEQSGIDVRNDKPTMMRIREAAEKAKIELSNIITTEINLPFLAIDTLRNPRNLELSITRAKLEELVSPIIERCRSPLIQALQDAKLSPSDIDKIILIGGPTRMPIVQQFVATVMGKDPERGVDPMEAVAIGAAIEANEPVIVLDVTPLTLGIEVIGGLVDPVIERNTTIPTKVSKMFTTSVDNQTTVTFNVVQGERPSASDNTLLGTFNLSGIPALPREVSPIEVIFDIDVNGILNVSAKHLDTSKEAKITVTSKVKLTDEEKRRLMQDMGQYVEEDKRKKEESEIINQAHNLIYTTDRLIKQDLKDKITSEQVRRIRRSVRELKDAIGISNIPNIKEKIPGLKKKDAIGTTNVNTISSSNIPNIRAKIYILKSILVNKINPLILKEYYGNSHAIIVGISKYKEETPLANAYNDAIAIEKVLKEKYGFNILTSLYNENATAENITHIFTDLLQDKDVIGSKDRIIIYYSGHGKLRTILNRQAQEIKQGFIVPYDSNKHKYNLNVPMQTLVESCQNCAAKHVLLILDCCYSGIAAIRAGEAPKQKASQFYLKEIASRSATQVIAAGQEDEAVSDSGKRPGYSAFTGALLDILDMERDLDDDGILTASEIGYNLGKEVILHQKGIYQKPVYTHITGSEGGDFIFKLFDISI
jgi:molecular chaperone DnaK